jgi:patatin-related protein
MSGQVVVAMKEKELRLALVCYGGISLAVYMHGVTKDILKLVRASRAYHGIPDVDARRSLSYAECSDAAVREAHEIDTENVYFDILKSIGRHLDLRVIVDVIAGTSAGGINGIFLARALAHDLPMHSLRDMWLVSADVTELLAPERKAKAWSKWFLHPAIWFATRAWLRTAAPDSEIRSKLSIFLRSRWFRAPFDGPGLSRVLFDAITTMGAPPTPGASLVPPGQLLELFVTLTDFYGYVRHIPLHDPPQIAEREHRHTVRFAFRRWPNGDSESDFGDGDVPSLVFAARATSSFPGAFPPVQFREIDHVARHWGIGWPNRRRFLDRNFGHYERAGGDPEKTSFVDGSVLNNKPFYEAIQAIRDRAAYRQVDRRLVYIDPDPSQPPPPPDGRVPSFFRTIKDALSDIPRNQPIYDDLALVESLNQKARRLRTVVEAARPQVVRLVGQVMHGAPGANASIDEIGRWRRESSAAAERESGFAFEGYVRLKLTLLIEDVARTVSGICGHRDGSPDAARVASVVDGWARESGVYPEVIVPPRRTMWLRQPKLPPWVEFLLRFDGEYRRRRVRFVIRSLNQLYPRLAEPEFTGVTAEHLDALKGKFYGVFDLIRPSAANARVQPATAALVQAAFARAGTLPHERDVPGAMDRRELGDGRVDRAIAALAADLDFAAADNALDAAFAGMASDSALGPVREDLIVNYIGFAFWDVLTFSIANRRDLGEFDEIRVDRISPEDCETIRAGGAAATLKGIGFNHFAAFFSRRHRENDYLWGRLHAAERLIDILVDAARIEGAADALDVRALKKRAFLDILATEEANLVHSADLFAILRAEIENI